MTAGQRGATPLDLRMFLALEGLPVLKTRLAAVMVLASEAAMFGPALGAMAVGDVRHCVLVGERVFQVRQDQEGHLECPLVCR